MNLKSKQSPFETVNHVIINDPAIEKLRFDDDLPFSPVLLHNLFFKRVFGFVLPALAFFLWYDSRMKSRTAARELAILILFQLGKQGKSALDANRGMNGLIIDAVRSLVEQASEQIQSTAQDFANISQHILELEAEHPANLESDLEAESVPVQIPTTRQMVEKIEILLQGAENLAESLRIPEFSVLARADITQRYTHQLVNLVLAHRDELDTLIDQHSEDWKVNRMIQMDRLILHIALAEIVYVDEVDTATVINEAVELAKKFSSDESFRFINGILGKIALKYPDTEKKDTSSEVPYV